MNLANYSPAIIDIPRDNLLTATVEARRQHPVQHGQVLIFNFSASLAAN
jgi:hypothetical protein